MRHLMKGRHLNRKSQHLVALKRNLASRLFVHERIRTTVPKAKELRPFAERIITLAKAAAAQLEIAKTETLPAKQAEAKAKALYARRRIIQILGGKKVFVVGTDAIDVVNKLVNDIGPRFRTRQGGYTRIMKTTERRLGDASPLAFIELLRDGEAKQVRRSTRRRTPA